MQQPELKVRTSFSVYGGLRCTLSKTSGLPGKFAWVDVRNVGCGSRLARLLQAFLASAAAKARGTRDWPSFVGCTNSNCSISCNTWYAKLCRYKPSRPSALLSAFCSTKDDGFLFRSGVCCICKLEDSSLSLSLSLRVLTCSFA